MARILELETDPNGPESGKRAGTEYLQDSTRDHGKKRIAALPESNFREGFKAWIGWNNPHPRFPCMVAALKRYLRWSRSARFDVDLRYAIIAKFLWRNEWRFGANPRVLDAGCGPWGLAWYVDRECVGIDVQFPTGPPARELGTLRVRGSATQMPFRDGRFDVAASMDTLEHLPPTARPSAVREMFRVASKAVVIGVPYGWKAAAFDRRAQAIEQTRGTELDWRREHVANGLPDRELDDLIISLAAARQATRVWMMKHENLSGLRLRWRIGQSIPQSHPAYGLLMAPLYGLAKRFHLGSCYRRMYYVVFS